MRKLAALIILVIGIGADGALYSASAHAATPHNHGTQHAHHAHHGGKHTMQPLPFVWAH